MEVCPEIEAMRRLAAAARVAGRRVGFVPTMGVLHAGHRSLLDAGRRESDLLVMSCFVNPIQFDQQADFDAYPRDRARDEELARAAGVDVFFAPTAEQMYPSGFSTTVLVERLSERWEGAHRPGHFRGVTTVVLKLFEIVQPHRAYFGQKDYQQSVIIRRMVTDLNLGVEVTVLPTVREPDGLALSSRNVLLKPEERRQAPALYHALVAARGLIEGGEGRAVVLEKAMREILMKDAPLGSPDYVAVCNPDTLDPVDQVTGSALLALAVRFPSARLIDNMLVQPT
ncbi:MAG: pantoate--beta-alanine ligase [Candidatus Methylomirabilales bacterium]